MSWQLFDRIRAYLTSGNVYQYEPTFQDQDDLSKIISGNDFVDFSRQNALLQQTNLQINRLERYKDFEQMDEVGEITLALDMYADEASLLDPETGHAIRIRAKSKRVKQELERLFYDTLMVDRMLRPLIRYLCKFGDFVGEVVIGHNRDEVQALKFVNVYNFTRVETKFGDLVGFYYTDPISSAPVFLHPWQAMHLRLTSYESIYHPYGRSILDGARKDFKRLRLMEDAALVYRITRAPEKRVFSIPIGNIPPREVDEYIQRIAQRFKKEKFVDPATGAINERYSPLIQDDDFFLPKRPDGTGPSIETLPGAQNLDEIADIEYFKKKMVAALKIPFNRVGLGDDSEDSSKSIASTNPEFAKAIQWVQREVALGLKKVAIIHLTLQGFPIEDLRNFDLQMTASSAIDELYRIETWNSRADVIARLKDTQMFTDEWILTHFTDLSEDEIDDMQSKIKYQMMQQSGQGGGPALPLPESADDGSENLLFEIYDDDDDHKMIIDEARQMLDRERETNKLLRERKRSTEESRHVRNELDFMLMNNELDGLPGMDGDRETVLVEHGVDADMREDVKSYTKELLEGTDTITEEVEQDYDEFVSIRDVQEAIQQ